MVNDRTRLLPHFRCNRVPDRLCAYTVHPLNNLISPGKSFVSDRHQSASYPLRLQKELRAKLQNAADSSRRSLNAEMVKRLESSFIEGQQNVLDIENNAMLKALCAKLGVQTES